MAGAQPNLDPEEFLKKLFIIVVVSTSVFFGIVFTFIV